MAVTQQKSFGRAAPRPAPAPAKAAPPPPSRPAPKAAPAPARAAPAKAAAMPVLAPSPSRQAPNTFAGKAGARAAAEALAAEMAQAETETEAAPAKRGPGRPSNAEIAARGATNGTPHTNGANGAVSYTSQYVSGLNAKITELQAALDSAHKALTAYAEKDAKAKAKPSPVRTFEQLTTYPETWNVAEDDWRIPYAGALVNVQQFSYDKAGGIELTPNTSPIQALAAYPRAGDVGGKGLHCRASGMLALYIADDDGNWIGPWDGEPIYVTEHELGTLWAD